MEEKIILQYDPLLPETILPTLNLFFEGTLLKKVKIIHFIKCLLFLIPTLTLLYFLEERGISTHIYGITSSSSSILLLLSPLTLTQNGP